MWTDPGSTFVAFDLETTGLFPLSDRIVEVGAVRYDATGAVLDRFASLINPLIPCSPGAFKIHGLSGEVLATARLAEAVLPEFSDFLGDWRDTTLVAHNARFDLGFLRVGFALCNLPAPIFAVVDTLTLAKSRWPSFRSHSLPNLASTFGFPSDDTHRAGADAERVRRLWLELHAHSHAHSHAHAGGLVSV